jgi:hypothetical protein
MQRKKTPGGILPIEKMRAGKRKVKKMEKR